MTFSWVFGRSLYTVNIGDTEIWYAYDQEGIRTSKTIGNTYTKYHIIDGIMYGEQTTGANGTTEIFYFYDNNDRMYGFSYNGTMYYYQFNLQGDVTGIYDANGQLVVEYKYDAWGKVLSVTGSLANAIGQANPMRYRGYYYDNETGFYYLNTRYYDPEVGRFINADSVLDNRGVNTINMFAYCGNNPVNNIDSDGKWIIGTIVGGVIGGLAGGLGALVSGKSVAAGVITGAATGAALGAVVDIVTSAGLSTGVSLAIIGAASGVISGAGNVGNQYLNYKWGNNTNCTKKTNNNKKKSTEQQKKHPSSQTNASSFAEYIDYNEVLSSTVMGVAFSPISFGASSLVNSAVGSSNVGQIIGGTFMEINTSLGQLIIDLFSYGE